MVYFARNLPFPFTLNYKVFLYSCLCRDLTLCEDHTKMLPYVLNRGAKQLGELPLTQPESASLKANLNSGYSRRVSVDDELA